MIWKYCTVSYGLWVCLSQPELKTFQWGFPCRILQSCSCFVRFRKANCEHKFKSHSHLTSGSQRAYSLSCHADHLWVPSHVSVQRFPTFWQVEPQKVHQAEGKPWLRNSTWTIRWHLFLRTLQRSEANKTAKSRVHRLQWFAISVWFTYSNSNHFKPPWLVSGDFPVAMWSLAGSWFWPSQKPERRFLSQWDFENNTHSTGIEERNGGAILVTVRW